ncbi:MAG TPA: TetR/AcrR family transcriptional regulator [Clostridiales bacterium]|nr:TetR/AcrR family transcriptional regulator [Clostridiales bacterium]
MKGDTKTIILDEALSLFAVKGYDGVTVQDIARAVGIKAPSLYKHYKSKQDIFDAILIETENRYKKQVLSMNMNGSEPEKDKDLFLGITEEDLYEKVKGLFLYYLHDEYAVKIRRMMTIGQYQNERLSDLYKKQYIDDALLYQKTLFQFFIYSGVFESGDPQMMAIQFYAPIYLLMINCDNRSEREKESLAFLKEHVRQFGQLYSNKEK